MQTLLMSATLVPSSELPYFRSGNRWEFLNAKWEFLPGWLPSPQQVGSSLCTGRPRMETEYQEDGAVVVTQQQTRDNPLYSKRSIASSWLATVRAVPLRAVQTSLASTSHWSGCRQHPQLIGCSWELSVFKMVMATHFWREGRVVLYCMLASG